MFAPRERSRRRSGAGAQASTWAPNHFVAGVSQSRCLAPHFFLISHATGADGNGMRTARVRLSSLGVLSGISFLALWVAGCDFHPSSQFTPAPEDGGTSSKLSASGGAGGGGSVSGKLGSGSNDGGSPSGTGGAAGAGAGTGTGGTGSTGGTPVCPAQCPSGQVCLSGTCQNDPCVGRRQLRERDGLQSDLRGGHRSLRRQDLPDESDLRRGPVRRRLLHAAVRRRDLPQRAILFARAPASARCSTPATPRAARARRAISPASRPIRAPTFIAPQSGVQQRHLRREPVRGREVRRRQRVQQRHLHRHLQLRRELRHQRALLRAPASARRTARPTEAAPGSTTAATASARARPAASAI